MALDPNPNMHLGPSLKSIADTFADVDAWLDEQVWTYTDFDGSRQDVPLTDEQQQACQRHDQLKELMRLRSHPLADEWGIAKEMGYCPCPGVPEERWNPDYDDGDAVGDMLGRNE